MNDFTKDELEDIANCIWIYDDMREDSMHAELLKKVQSMIDNYCEHEWRRKPPYNIMACIKCEKVYCE